MAENESMCADTEVFKPFAKKILHMFFFANVRGWRLKVRYYD